jgi:signal peptidase I
MIPKKGTKFREFLSYLIVAVIAAVFSITIRIFVIEPFIVPSPSMSPTLLVNDKVLVNKLAYSISDIEKGDIIAFYSTVDQSKGITKRVIATGNEKVHLDTDGEVYVDGELIDEPYLPDNVIENYQDFTIILEEDELFVMGDNRNNSSDSRFFGPISESDVFGKVVFIYGPFNRIGIPR